MVESEKTERTKRLDEYNMLAQNGHGSVTNSVECLPNEEWMRGMYADGCVLLKNGKKLKLEQALKEITKK